MSIDENFGQLAPIDIVPAYEVVARYLRRSIHLGEFAPGSKLPRERDLAKSLGVSQVTLREALRKLKGEGYVEMRRGQRGGVFLLEERASREALRKWFYDHGTDLAGVFAFRAVVESMAARRAAARADDVLVDELTDLNARMREAAEVGPFRQADLRFHMRIAAAAGAPLVQKAVEEARVALFMPFQLMGLEELQDHSIEQHGRVIDAIRAGDEDTAESAMATHIRDVASGIYSTDLAVKSNSKEYGGR